MRGAVVGFGLAGIRHVVRFVTGVVIRFMRGAVVRFVTRAVVRFVTRAAVRFVTGAVVGLVLASIGHAVLIVAGAVAQRRRVVFVRRISPVVGNDLTQSRQVMEIVVQIVEVIGQAAIVSVGCANYGHDNAP